MVCQSKQKSTPHLNFSIADWRSKIKDFCLIAWIKLKDGEENKELF